MEDCAQMTKVTVKEAPAVEAPVRKVTTKNKFIKRAKDRVSKSAHLSDHSTSSDDEPFQISRIKPIPKKNESHSTVMAVETQPLVHHRSNSSLDSIENKPIDAPTRAIVTFSELSPQRAVDSVPAQRSNPPIETATLTRTFAFDRACMEKYRQTSEDQIEVIKSSMDTVCEMVGNEEINLQARSNKSRSVFVFYAHHQSYFTWIFSESIERSEDKLQSRSFINVLPTPFYLGHETSTNEGSEFDRSSSISRQKSEINQPSKSSSIRYLMKKYARTVTSEYRLAHHQNEKRAAEPTLLEVKYLDGRLSFKDDSARESFRQPRSLNESFSSRLNRLGGSKVSSIQDLSATKKPLEEPYRKRMFNRFRNLLDQEPAQAQSFQPRPWQHKTIIELFYERKYRVNRH